MIPAEEFIEVVGSGLAHLRFGVGVGTGAVVLTGKTAAIDHAFHDALSAMPFVIVGTETEHADICDVLIENDLDLDEIRASLAASPLACITLASLLRGAESRSVEESLVAESAAYSVLQGGPEFQDWRERTPKKQADDSTDSPVMVTNDGDLLHISFNRPQRHNAFNTDLQAAFVNALTIATSDESLRVLVDGNGPSFCSGGDLDEFGDRPDTATAHVVRLTRSAGRLLCQLGDRVEFNIHGACMGAGIELPAFAPSVSARDDIRIALPEIRLGLIPGAGGTASMPRRIGRHRTALLGLTARTIDASTALSWGLIDRIV